MYQQNNKLLQGRNVKKGTQIEGIVNRVDFPNKGIVEIDGEKITIKNTLPGQKINAVINKSRKGRSEAKLIEVIERSPLETVEAKCKHFGPCGGCTYQTIPYETQLDMKAEQVKRLLDPVCSEYEFLGIKGSPVQWGYRNKMEFSFGDEEKDGPLALGLHKKGSFYDIITTSDCQIVDEDYNQILSCVLAYFTSLSVSFYKKLSHIGYLRHLLVRRAAKTGEILVNLITSTQWMLSTPEEEAMEKLKSELLKLSLNGTIVGILHTHNDSQADVVQSDRMDILYGQDYFFEEILGLKFKISTFSFFQTNSLGAEVLYSTAREFVGETKDKLIFDLYSGTGTIAQLLAPVAKKVVGVEIVEEAVKAARVNAEFNDLNNCEFIAGDVLKVIDSIEDKPDLIVLDPPRDGIHPKALEKIIDFSVDRMVYISCKPTSLARDLVVLQERGYKVEKVWAVDMFPGTVHVEAVIMMTYCGQDKKTKG
jgi:23S rRNA (uracil-5-)-methyltransferase RumA